jgi:hypothetical protein
MNAVPGILQPLSNDEYVPPPHTTIKRKVLAGKAARVYGVDYDELALATETDDLSWTYEVLAAYGSAADQPTDT